jgi:hypothetical protein
MLFVVHYANTNGATGLLIRDLARLTSNYLVLDSCLVAMHTHAHASGSQKVLTVYIIIWILYTTTLLRTSSTVPHDGFRLRRSGAGEKIAKRIRRPDEGETGYLDRQDPVYPSSGWGLDIFFRDFRLIDQFPDILISRTKLSCCASSSSLFSPLPPLLVATKKV